MIRSFDTDGAIEPIVRTLPEPEPTTVTLDEVKTAIVSLAETATQSVQVVRDAFAVGVAPLQVASSGSVSSYLTAITKDPLAAKIVKSTSHLGLKTSTAGSSVPPPRPELDSAEVIEDQGGVLDQFSVELTVSIPIDQLSKIKAVKIMRAKLGKVKAVRPMLSALIGAPSVPSSGKGFDPIAMAAFRAADSGVGNQVTTFIADDPNDLQRSVISPQQKELRPPVPPQNTNRGETSAGLISITGAERSVVEDLNFYLTRRSIGAVPGFQADTVGVGSRNGINVLKGDSVASSSPGVVQEGNSMKFSEVGRVDMAGSGVRSIGSFRVGSFVDKAVVYGAGFMYYAVCVAPDGSESVRSRMVKVPVVKQTPPQPPIVSYSIIGGHPRFVVRCPQGVDHVEVFRSGRSVPESVRLGSEESIIVKGPAAKVGQYWHLTDLGLAADRSTSFVDTKAVSGDRLSYRFYTVDPYGMKCQTPFSCSLAMPEHGRPIPLPVPSVTAEQTVGQPRVDVKMAVDDPRVRGFIVQRRDVTIRERSLHQANQPEFVDIGPARDPKRAGSRRGPTLMDVDWPVFIPASQGSASFVDTSVKTDRVYQYAIGAVDVRGNRTLTVGSDPVGVYVRQIVDPPTSFGAEVIVDQDTPKGVLLTWTGGTNDFAPNSLMGDQDALQATSVRSVYQVERRSLGSPFWDALPATSESWFFDAASEVQAPPYRPAYVIPGTSYEYRVMAMQSGGFLSPRSDAITVPVIPPPRAPETVWVRSTALDINPVSVIVSWNMSAQFVEKWEVERAVTNKIYGSQIQSMASAAARNLDYRRVAEITPESSRARAMSADTRDLDRSIYVGNRFYVDGDISAANTYFYRVRTVSAKGKHSDWSYGGVILNDSAFDRKFYSVLSDDDKISLAQDSRPIGKTTPDDIESTISTKLITRELL
jgi:hypothetical protein